MQMPPERKKLTQNMLTSSKKRNRMVTSWIWNHEEMVEHKDGTKSWHCNHCPRGSSCQYIIAETSNPALHLRKAHGITETGKIATNQTMIESSMNQPRRDGLNAMVLWKVLIKWIIDRRHPFNEVTAESFPNIIATIDKSAVKKLPNSRNTI
jgi:hypothetical protein